MPAKLDDKQQQDDRYNPYNYDYNSERGLKEAEEKSSSYDDDSDQSVDGLQQLEQQTSGIKSSFTGKRKGNGKKLSIAGVISALVVTGGVAFFVNQVSMSLSPISDPIDDMNNSLADAYEKRSVNVLARIFDDGKLCSNGEVGLRCKTSRVSNKTLYNLDKNGVTANFEDGTSYKGDRKGFPDKKPVSYTFRETRTASAKTIKAADMRGFLASQDSAAYASKILGRRGAFNLRGEVMRGKALNKVFGALNLKFDGARDFKKGQTTRATYEAAHKTMHKDTPPVSAVEDAASSSKVKAKFDDLSKRLGKGGVAYVTLAGGCLAIKAPAIVAASVTAVELARIAPIANNLILSPASHQKVSGVDKDNAITPDQLEAVMTVLTQKTPRESDGKMTSALNSPILLSAMGVNKNKAPLNPDVSPGYAVLNNKWVTGAGEIEKATEPYCNFMLSPMTMYTFATADAAVSIGAGFVSGGVGTAVTRLASQVVQVGLSYVAGEVVSIASSAALKGIVENIVSEDIIGTAQGEELGDVLGTSAMALYSSAGMGRGLPVLSQSQLPGFDQVRAELNAQQQSYDIATLSPFDTSSKYTFFGSIVNNMQSFAFANNLYTNNSISSIASAITAIPSFAFNSSTAGAAAQSYSNYCGYADDFGLYTGDPATTPGVNASGMPCTGVNQNLMNMSVDEAINIVETEGWVNAMIEYPEDASPEELVGTVIEADSPIATYLETCGHPELGNALFDSAGCMFPGAGVGAGQEAINENKNYCSYNECTDSSGGVAGDVSVRSMQAIPVFLMDFQMSQIIQDINSSEDEAVAAPTDDAAGSDDTGQVSGDAAQLAQQLLDSPNVTFWDQPRDAGDKSRPSDNLRSIAAGELANTSNRGPAAGKKTTIDVNLLKFLVELSQKTDIMINALAGQKHSAKSKHYDGLAVDFNCGHGLSAVADPIAKKYGVGRNWENCTPAGNNHWHYEVGR